MNSVPDENGTQVSEGHDRFICGRKVCFKRWLYIRLGWLAEDAYSRLLPQIEVSRYADPAI